MVRTTLSRWWALVMGTAITLGALPVTAAESTEVEVRTASVWLAFSTHGGVPVRWDIIDPRYVRAGLDVLPGGDAGVALLGRGIEAASDFGPFDVLVPGLPGETEFFRKTEYGVQRTEDADAFAVTFTSPVSPAGLTLVKTFQIAKRGFVARITLHWSNARNVERALGDEPSGPGILLGPDLGLRPPREAGLAGSLYSYVDVAERTSARFRSHSLSSDAPELVLGGDSGPLHWAGLHNRYFLMALIGGDGPTDSIMSGRARLAAQAVSGDGPSVPPEKGVRLELFSAPQVLAASGGSQQQRFSIYAGPKERGALQEADPTLDDILFNRLWNWLRWLCHGLMWVLSGLHALVPNWGLAIILLAVVVRLVLFPVAQSGLRAQAKTNADNERVRPHLERVKEQFKDDAVRRHEETMKVYKEHGVNPYAAFKGCGWLMLQLPIFIALFNVIGQAYELRGVNFLWIKDLAAPDRLFDLGFTIPLLGSSFNLLPVLMAGTQVLTSNLAPAGGSEKQRRSQHRIMVLMAVAFLVLFYNFPAGLVLYWTCANLGHLLQQRLIRPNRMAT